MSVHENLPCRGWGLSVVYHKNQSLGKGGRDMANYQLFVDLDGVLVDFDRGVLQACGASPDDLEPKIMWRTVARISGFYENLAWMRDGRQLWNLACQYSPIILTGLPRGNWAEGQKRRWCQRELGAEVSVITCLSREKHLEARAIVDDGIIPILVDDRFSLKDDWEDIGGIFIHHTSAELSLARLRELGFS